MNSLYQHHCTSEKMFQDNWIIHISCFLFIYFICILSNLYFSFLKPGCWYLWTKSNPNAHAVCLHVWKASCIPPKEGGAILLYSVWLCAKAGKHIFETKYIWLNTLKIFYMFLIQPEIKKICLYSIILSGLSKPCHSSLFLSKEEWRA